MNAREPAHAAGGNDDETRAARPAAFAHTGCALDERAKTAAGTAQSTGSSATASPAADARDANAPTRCGVLSERDPDAELVARVGARDAGAVRMLVLNKLPRLVALATRMLGDRMEAEDVAQEAFVRIWKQAPHWRSGEAKFDTWLHRVALNLCYDRLRGRREAPAETLPDEPDPAAAPEQRLEARTRDERVRAALAALPVRQREALVLTYYQELSNLEAAGLMGISVDALESLLARARRTLRAQLAGEGAGKDSV
ncbi:MAG TPA: RNA polymerase sigma factor [Paraburkholderia sp.]|nr:RNA polymerase sigma factor [Paraburkholderia sp.]